MKFHLILAALVAFPIACQAADLQSREQPPAYIDASMQPAFDTEVQRRRDIEQFLAPIKSAQDLQAHLANWLGRGSPLDALSPHARERFLAGLSFNARGLTGYRYDDVEAELSVSQAFELLGLFGVQDTLRILHLRQTTDRDAQLLGLYVNGGEHVAADHYNYRCASRASCEFSRNFICMTGCAAYIE